LVGWKAGKETQYQQLAGLSISALAEAPDATVWVAGYSFNSNGKLCAIRMTQVSCQMHDRLGNGALGLHVDRGGTLWAATTGGFWRWAPGPSHFYSVPATGTGYQGFSEDGSGGLLIPLIGRAARVNVDVLETAFLYPSLASDARGARMLHDRDGADWVGTVSHGLIRAHAGVSETFSSSDGLTGDTVDAVFEDREGNIWAGTDKGLDRFSSSSVATFSEQQGLATPLVSVVTAHDGSIWTSAPGRIYKLQGGRVTLNLTSYSRPPAGLASNARSSTDPGVRVMPPFQYVTLFEDFRGRIWLVGPEISGYLRGERFIPLSEVPRGTVYAITGEATGHVWISIAERGLVHIFQDHLQEILSWSELGSHGLVTALAVDPKTDSVWIGFSKGGVAVLRQGKVQKIFTTSDGLGTGRVSDLRFDSEGNLWAATDGGLSRLMGGRFNTTDSSQGLPCDRLYWSARAEDRSLWVYGECGLIHVASAEVDALITRKGPHINTTLSDASDGVSLFTGDLGESISPPAAVAPDGSIWFRTLGGLNVVRPHSLAINPVAPPVQIERLIADGNAYNLSEDVLLPPRVRDLAIEYTALSFVAPEKIHFRYRLQGQDSSWREVVNDRRVQYSNLAPGNYRFQVIADNNSGIWNEQGATLDFSIAPAYWQTFWFRMACAAVVLVILWLLYRVRLHQIARQFERTLDARVAERTRIARELHDTLLQSFHGLLLQFQAVSHLFQHRPAEAKQLLDSAIDQVAAAVTEGRDAVQGLRNSIEESSSLPEAIGTLAEELSEGRTHPRSGSGAARPTAIRVDIDGITRDVHPIVRDEIYRIAAEALRNAVQHSRANRIEVELHYGRRSLRLRVHDDGIGIEAQVASAGHREGHFGLAGMRERAELAGGKLAIWSAQGVGTEVELTVPAARAYQDA
jgi:signal transduction histidine kinase